MKQGKQDRRSLRTRRLVTSALMELLLEKRFDAITVQDLLDRAGIGRSTFYAHYFDKDDVLAQIAEQMLETFRMRVAQDGARQTGDAGPAGPAGHADGQAILPSLEIFRHVQQQYPQLRALVRGHAGEVLWATGQALLRQNIERTLTTTYTQV
ncbi:MAG TPA: TetR/AcrR family transcriptional regulator, partial [Ktedonobacterales bacterium]|nr:TetR/AcrR family transcriptional regulator [Ktedonobacterales bacterium]